MALKQSLSSVTWVLIAGCPAAPPEVGVDPTTGSGTLGTTGSGPESSSSAGDPSSTSLTGGRGSSGPSTTSERPDTGSTTGGSEADSGITTDATGPMTTGETASTTTGETSAESGETGPMPCDPSTVNTVEDGGFEREAGDSPWQESSPRDFSSFCPSTQCDRGNPLAGAGFLWLGGTGSADWSIGQSITIAPGTRTLTVHMVMAASGNVDRSFFRVRIDNDPILTIRSTDYEQYPLYTPVYVDVSSYADGQRHIVEFYVADHNLDSPTNVLLDEVSLGCDPIPPTCIGPDCGCESDEFIGGGRCVPCSDGPELFDIISAEACHCALAQCPGTTDDQVAACVSGATSDTCRSSWDADGCLRGC